MEECTSPTNKDDTAVHAYNNTAAVSPQSGADKTPKGDVAVVVVDTDWRIDETGGRRFGICSVNVSEPFAQLSVKRGYPLTNPTRVRCAAFALRMGLEVAVGALCNAAALARVGGPRTVVTHCSVVADVVVGSASERTRLWLAGEGGKALLHGFARPFWLSIMAPLDWLRERSMGDVILIAPAADENVKKDVLQRRFVQLDVDAPIAGKADEKEVDDMRKRAIVRTELMESVGARSSRAHRKLTKKEAAKK